MLSSSYAKWLVERATDLATIYPNVLDAVTKTLETAAGRCPQQLRRSVASRLKHAEYARRRDHKVVNCDSDDSHNPAELEKAWRTVLDLPV